MGRSNERRVGAQMGRENGVEETRRLERPGSGRFKGRPEEYEERLGWWDPMGEGGL